MHCFSFTPDNAPEANKKDLLAEYELMKELEPHPNVIRLIGAVTQSGTFIIHSCIGRKRLLVISHVRHIVS